MPVNQTKRLFGKAADGGSDCKVHTYQYKTNSNIGTLIDVCGKDLQLSAFKRQAQASERRES